MLRTLAFFLLLFWGSTGQQVRPPKVNIVEHQITLLHPGISLTEAVPSILYEVKNEQDRPQEYFMKVETVVCGDALCRIDTIRVFWDTLGFYNRFELPPGVQLEKAAGKYFTGEDYQKLQTILADKNNSLANVYKEEVTGRESSDGLDGVSGATIILHKKDYVQGAVWTCYTLWHWVNGGVVPIIRNITGDHHRLEDLVVLLKTEPSEKKIFALEQLLRRKIYTPEIVKQLIDNAPFNNYALTKLTIECLGRTSADLYFDAMKKIIIAVNNKQKALYLKALLTNDKNVPHDFYADLIHQLPQWNDYPSTDLLLKNIENQKTDLSTIIPNLLSLLNDDNFLIARRVYWYLNKQSLDPAQQKIVEAFFLKYQDRL